MQSHHVYKWYSAKGADMVTSCSNMSISEECRLLGCYAVCLLLMEALSSSETSALTRATWCNIPEDGILHSHLRENLKSYMSTSV
jgi:hypothetical protein